MKAAFIIALAAVLAVAGATAAASAQQKATDITPTLPAEVVEKQGFKQYDRVWTLDQGFFGRVAVNATCQAAGEVPISGGYIISGDYEVVANYPDLNSSSWQVAGNKFDIGETLVVVRVLCMSPQQTPVE